MATEIQDMAQILYLERPISRAILEALGDSSMAFSQVVSRTGYPSEEVAAWLLDLERNGLVSHAIELPQDKSEAVFCCRLQYTRFYNWLRRNQATGN